MNPVFGSVMFPTMKILIIFNTVKESFHFFLPSTLFDER